MRELLAIIFALQAPTEPMRLIEVDELAFEIALELAACMKTAQSAERERLRSMDFKARQDRIAEVCEIERRNAEILERLKVVLPEATQNELSEEHKNIMLLAIFHRPNGAPVGTGAATPHD